MPWDILAENSAWHKVSPQARQHQHIHITHTTTLLKN